jgi:FhaA, N-terminal domain/FHA domain
MNLLKSVETTIANLVEGAFGRIFRSEVSAMELARKLTREMDQHRTVSLSRVYAPNEYSVWLSPQDRARYEGVEHELGDELCAHLLEHARREELILVSHPLIVFHTDERLALGEFGIQARSVHLDQGEDADSRAPGELPSAHGQTMIYSTSRRVGGPAEEARARRGDARALLAVAGRRLLLAPTGGTVGRSRDCDVVLDDVGVSRRHADIRPGPDGWTIEDLGSTNGLLVNGRSVRGRQPLHPGDRVELGSTEIIFEVG